MASNPAYEKGTMVWARLPKIPWWPGICINPSDFGQKQTKEAHSWVFWFGDHKISNIHHSRICDFEHNYNLHTRKLDEDVKEAVLEALQIFAVMKKVDLRNPENLLKWATAGFQKGKPFISSNAVKRIQEINSNLPQSIINLILNPKCNADKREDENKTKGDAANKGSINNDERQEHLVSTEKQKVKKKVLKRYTDQEKKNEFEKGNEKQCISCCTFDRVFDIHPLFVGGLCGCCRRTTRRSWLKALGKKHQHCVICGQGVHRTLIYCKSVCKRAYCEPCLLHLLPPGNLLKINENVNWKCFACEDDGDPGCKIQYRKISIKNDEIDLHIGQEIEILKPINVLAFNEIAKEALRILNMKVGNFSTGKMGENSIPPEQVTSPNCYSSSFSEMKATEVAAVAPDLVIGTYFESCIPYGLKSPGEACLMWFLKFMFRLWRAREVTEFVYFIFFTESHILDNELKSRFTNYLHSNEVIISLGEKKIIVWSNIVGESRIRKNIPPPKSNLSLNNSKVEKFVLCSFIEPLRSFFEDEMEFMES